MNATDVLRYGQGTVLECLEELPDAVAEQPGACGSWSIKDIVAHLASYELVLVDILASLTQDGPTPWLDRLLEVGPGFNDMEVEVRRKHGLAENLAELNEAHDRTLELIAKIPPEQARQPGTLPWYGAEYSLDDLIAYQYYGHKREHCAQIAVFRDREER